MFAVGHLALGYITGKLADRLMNVKSNIFLLLLVSVIPDIDILIPGLEHRGPTHSLIIFVILFPVILLYGKKAVPYFVALGQHTLIGDYITEGAKLLWPLTGRIFGTGMKVTSLPNMFLEWCLFLIFIALAFKTRDIWLLFQHHRFNLLLSMPLFAVFIPTLFNFPIYVPFELFIPHLTFLTLFTLSIIKNLKALLAK